MKKHFLPIVILSIAFIQSASGAIVTIFSDDFEAGTLANWTTSGAQPFDISTAQNAVPATGRFSALGNHSADKMHRNIIADNGGVEVGGAMNFAFWLYDIGGPATGTVGPNRALVDIRGYSGGTGLPNGGTVPSGAIAQIFAAGKMSSVTLPGEVLNTNKYQGRVAFGPGTGGSTGYFNLGGPGSPNRSVGWHRFDIRRLADGTTIEFYVDGILSRTFAGAAAQSLDTISPGFGLGTQVGDYWVDGVLLAVEDNPPTITCPSNQTTVATSANGAVVTYPAPTVTDDRGTPTVACTPPSGSTFPIGTTSVNCTATDLAGQTNVCRFLVTVVLPDAGPEVRFSSDLLPPPQGMYISPTPEPIPYPNNILIRRIRNWRFTESMPPPPPGGTPQTYSFASLIQFEVSMDGGESWQGATADARTTVVVPHMLEISGRLYLDTEMVEMEITGGTLPPGVMIRESPTRKSLGLTSVQDLKRNGPALIGSFFDVFTELSVDGGQNWMPAGEAARVELRLDPQTIPPIPAPTNLLPPPLDAFAMPRGDMVSFAQKVLIRNVRNRFWNQSLPPPPPGGQQLHDFESQLTLEMSQDGGERWQKLTSKALVSVILRHLGPPSFVTTSPPPTTVEGHSLEAAIPEKPRQLYEAEIIRMDIAGGDLPPGVIMREDPTKRSLGGVALESLTIAHEGFELHSFFDISLCLSLDGGQVYIPADASSRVTLVSAAPERGFPTPALPPQGGEFATLPEWVGDYGQGLLLRNVRHHSFSESLPPPPPGGQQIQQFRAQVDFEMSMDGGQTFRPMKASADLAVLVKYHMDYQGVSFYDTELLALQIAGGDLPPGAMLRESPTRASVGRTSIRPQASGNGFWIESYFEVESELTIDGGERWFPNLTLPPDVILGGGGCADLKCPPDMLVGATSASGAVVNYPPPQLTSTCPTDPIVICTPPSGSTFPIGTTTVTCRAEVAPGAVVATCSFRITVRGDIEIDRFSNTVAQLTLCLPSGAQEDITATGPTTVHVFVGPQGQANDSDGDGRDDVETEMVQLSLTGSSSMGPVHIGLRNITKHPFQPSRGYIEELANTLPGRLDVPPFAPSGLAVSEFFLYLEVTVQTPNGPLVLHNHLAKRMRAVIDHKPPGPGTIYEFPDRIELFNENEQPTGIVICRTRHIPVPPEPEIDHFSNSVAQITLCRPDGTEVEDVQLVGPTTVHVFVGPQGQADDSDGDGLDDSRTEMVLMNLTGSSSMGPVTMRLRDISEHPFQPSGGYIEELANTQAGRLDLPPFAPSGQAESFFDVFVEIEVQTPNGPLLLHNDRPKRMRAIIDHKPPGPGTVYEFPEVIPLLLENEQPSGFTICKSRHITECRIAIACPTNITVCNDQGECGAKVNYPAPIVNASCPPVVVLCMPPSGSFFNLGNTPVTCTARDSRGNQASCTFNVSVRDCEPPRIVCPNDIVVPNEPNACSARVIYPAPTTSDNCPGAITVVCTPPSGSPFPVGTRSVTCIATDGAGNASQCRFDVTVRDTELPRLVCPNDIFVNNDPNVCGAKVNYPAATATDNCPGLSAVTCTPASGSTFPVGTTTVNCTAVDGSANIGRCTFMVTVRDMEPPTIVCPSNIVVRTCERRAVVTYMPTASDNCPGVTWLCYPPSGTAFPTGSHVVRCHAIDAVGHTSQTGCTFTVTIETAPAPTLTITFLPGGKVMICWTTDCPGWQLQCTRSLNPPIMWEPVTEPVVTTGSRHCVTLPASGAHRFYRLIRREVKDIFAPTDNFPPQGAYLSPGDEMTVIPLPTPIGPRPVLMRWFVYQIPPTVPTRPPPCQGCPPETFQFAGDVMFQASLDDGRSWVEVHPEPKLTAIQVIAQPPDPGAPQVRMFNMEMLRLEGAGTIGGVQMSGLAGIESIGVQFRLRESPTRASVGRTTVMDGGDGTYRIGSFFDVFIELSVDGGQTWGAAETPVRMELTSSPPEQFHERVEFPPPGNYAGPPGEVTDYGNGILARWFVHPIPPGGCPGCPPPPCLSCPPDTYRFTADVSLYWSINGGQTWNAATGKSETAVRVKARSGGDQQQLFDTELLQLNISAEPTGGGNVRLRESPTLPSTGITSVRQVSGGYRIGSFFDVFTEISVDFGETWWPARKPSHVIHYVDPPPVAERTDMMPPEGSYNSSLGQVIRYRNGILARRFSHPITVPPIVAKPPPCLTCPPETYELISDVTLEVSVNGGQNWQRVSGHAVGNSSLSVCWLEGGAPVYGGEILRLDVAGQGPGLPPFMIRESPTRRSQGLTQIGTSPNLSRPYNVSSFFDVWTELSLDGGQTWAGSDEAAHVTLNPQPLPPGQ